MTDLLVLVLKLFHLILHLIFLRLRSFTREVPVTL